MKALILGATGAVGTDLTSLLLDDPAFEEVDIFVRRAPAISHPKLQVHVVDFEHPEEWSQLVLGDVAFSCMGTTLKAAGSQDAQYRVDYTYQYEFAKRASINGVLGLVLVSSAMADARSHFFYTRIKGELEDAVRQLPFSRLSILRPPALIRKNTDRVSERISLPILRFFNRIGLFRKQTPMETMTVARAMVALAKNSEPPVLVEPNAIRRFSEE